MAFVKDPLCNDGCDHILLGLELGPKLKKYELHRIDKVTTAQTFCAGDGVTIQLDARRTNN